jgi:hypothetical protein
VATTNTFGIADTHTVLDCSNRVQRCRTAFEWGTTGHPTGMAGEDTDWGNLGGLLVDHTQSYSQHLWPTTNFALAHNTMFDRSNCVQVMHHLVQCVTAVRPCG